MALFNIATICHFKKMISTKLYETAAGSERSQKTMDALGWEITFPQLLLI